MDCFTNSVKQIQIALCRPFMPIAFGIVMTSCCLFSLTFVSSSDGNMIDSTPNATSATRPRTICVLVRPVEATLGAGSLGVNSFGKIVFGDFLFLFNSQFASTSDPNISFHSPYSSISLSPNLFLF